MPTPPTTGVAAKGVAGTFVHESAPLGVSAKGVAAGEAKQPPPIHSGPSVHLVNGKLFIGRHEMPDHPRPVMAAGVPAVAGRAELTLRPDSASTDAAALHAEMLRRIDALERTIARPRASRGIGDNNPPEPIEPEPLSASELREIRRAMAVLKIEATEPRSPSIEAAAAVSVLTRYGDRLRPLTHTTIGYAGRQADNFITAAVKEAGKRIVQSPFWFAVIHQLPALADIAHRWLESLAGHF